MPPGRALRSSAPVTAYDYSYEEQTAPAGSAAAGALAPPHSLEAEQSVLGAVLLSDKAHYAYVIEEGLQARGLLPGAPPGHLRVDARALLRERADRRRSRSPSTCAPRGALEEAGGPAEIDALTAAVPAVGNLRRYGQIVREMSLLRQLLNATYEIQASVHNHEGLPRDIVEHAEKAMLEVGRDDRQKDFRKVGEVLHEELDTLARAVDRGQRR